MRTTDFGEEGTDYGQETWPSPSQTSILDWLLPQSFQSDVGAVFKPGQLSAEDFSPGTSDRELYDRYLDLYEAGLVPSSESIGVWEGQDISALDLFTKTAEDLGMTTSGHKGLISQFLGRAESGLQGERPEGDYGLGFDMYKAPSMFNEQSILDAFSGVGMSGLAPEAVNPLKLRDLRKLGVGHYSPYIEEGRGKMIPGMTSARESARGIGRGIAGSGRRDVEVEGIETDYLGSMDRLYSQVDELRGKELEKMYGALTSYEDMIADMGA